MELDIQRFADGKVVIQTELDTKNFKNGLDRMQNTAKGAGTSIKGIVAGLGITKLISAAFNTIRNSMDDAITRMDTLNNFPKVMSNLGVSAKDSEQAISKMSDKLAGLPTTLDQGASAVQRFTSKNGDVKKSTNIFLALNNAILAGGAPTEMQATALEQLSQAYAKGKPDMMEWRSAMSAMPAQLKQVAQAMGYVNADELGEALRNGTVSMDDFMDTITKLNTEGVNGFKSFEEQARNSTGGIRTSITVAKTQIVKGVADMIEGLNKGLKKAKLGSISEIIANLGKSFKKELDKMAVALSKIDFKKVVNAMKILIPVVGSLTTAFISYHSALKVIDIQRKITAGITAMTNPIGLAAAGVAGLTVGIMTLAKVTEKQDTAQQKITNTLIEYDKAMKQANASRQASLDKNMNEIAGIESLYSELQSLVDANGRVKAGYEDRVKFIVGELNSALGTEITMTDGVIQNYDEMRNSINQVIEAKRAKVLLDAQEKVYNEAKDHAAKLEKEYANAVKEANASEKERNAVLKEIQSTYGLTNKQLKDVAQNYSYIDENGKRVNISLDSLGKKLQETNNNFDTNKRNVNDAGKAYANNQKIIGDYENALINLKNKNYSAVLGMYEDTTNYQGKTKQNTVSNYQAAIKSQEDYLSRLKANKSKYDTDVYNAEVNATNQRINKLKEGLAKEEATISTTHTKIKDKYSKSAKDNADAYGQGLDAYTPFAKKKSEDFINNATSSMASKGKEKGRPAGKAVGQGYNEGILSEVANSIVAATTLVNSSISAIKKAAKIHSPSRVTMALGKNFAEGFGVGFDDEIDNIYRDIQNTISSESSKIQANVETGKVFNSLVATTPVNVNLNAGVELDGQKVGRLITPEVSRTIKSGGGV